MFDFDNSLARIHFQIDWFLKQFAQDEIQVFPQLFERVETCRIIWNGMALAPVATLKEINKKNVQGTEKHPVIFLNCINK